MPSRFRSIPLPSVSRATDSTASSPRVWGIIPAPRAMTQFWCVIHSSRTKAICRSGSVRKTVAGLPEVENCAGKGTWLFKMDVVPCLREDDQPGVGDLLNHLSVDGAKFFVLVSRKEECGRGQRGQARVENWVERRFPSRTSCWLGRRAGCASAATAIVAAEPRTVAAVGCSTSGATPNNPRTWRCPPARSYPPARCPSRGARLDLSQKPARAIRSPTSASARAPGR